jgi:hypothetical protein
MRTFSREFSAVQLLHGAANNFRQVFTDSGSTELLQCYDHIIAALASFTLCELNIRQAERCETAGIQQGRASDLRDLATTYNESGVESLQLALDRVSTAEEGESSAALTDEQQAQLSRLINDFQRGLTVALVETEVKPGDLREVLDGLDNVSQAIRASTSVVASLGRLRRDIERLIQLRTSPDRGAATNIPGWKVAGIILLVGVGYVVYVRCIQQNNCTTEQKLFLAAAGVTGSLMPGACE